MNEALLWALFALFAVHASGAALLSVPLRRNEAAYGAFLAHALACLYFLVLVDLGLWGLV